MTWVRVRLDDEATRGLTRLQGLTLRWTDVGFISAVVRRKS